jgi:2,3-dihydroxybiphenyl 1,2-dioxygenase
MDERAYRFLLTEGPADDVVFVGWETPNASTLEAFSRHLEALGVKWQWGSDEERALREVERLLHFTDPDNVRHEVFFGPRVATDRFSSPKVASGFVTGDGGLGHVVLSSQNYAETLGFAQKVLGFSLSDHIRMQLGGGHTFQVSFLHANSRHHSYAVAPAPAGTAKRMHHFMIETRSVEDVGFARDRCLEMGLRVDMDIGQHPNDRMISFYGRTPSGFLVEFGYGGGQVDSKSWQVVTYSKLSEWGHRPAAETAIQINRASNVTADQTNVTKQLLTDTQMIESGRWKVVIKTPMGDQSVVFNLAVEGVEVQGTIEGANETNDIFDGTVDGTAMFWRSNVSEPLPMELEFTATIVGESISGGAKSPFGTAPFSGTRA